MKIQEVAAWMMQNGYILQVKGKFRLTAKFNKEILNREEGVVLLNQTPVVMEHALPAQIQSIDWPKQYMQFIVEAQVPARGKGGNGPGYDLNKYSEPAMKMFRRIIEKEKVQYPVLVKSTMLYYKTHKDYPLTISRYISEGFWRSDYEALLQSAEQGTVAEHIQQEISHGTEFNRFKPG